jgi:hypothetical protein
LFISALANIATITGAFLIYKQIKQATKSSDAQLSQANVIHEESSKHMTIRESVAIAKLFQEKIVTLICIITDIYFSSSLKEFADNRLSDKNIYDFEEKEATALFGPDCLERHNNALLNLDAKLAYGFLCAHLPNDHSLQSIKIKEDGSLDKNQVFEIRSTFFNMISDALNTLEWIAMLLNTGAANDDVIYQSLHQKLLPFIRLNYFSISSCNKGSNPVDKFYCNLLELYNRWNSKRLEKLNEIELAEKERADIMQTTEARLQKIEHDTRKRIVVNPPNVKQAGSS